MILSQKSLIERMRQAKTTGTLNLSNAELTVIPSEIYNFENLGVEGKDWWLENPLSKLNISQNDITSAE